MNKPQTAKLTSYEQREMIVVACDLELSHEDLSLGFVVQLGLSAFDTDTQEEVCCGSWFMYQPFKKTWHTRTWNEFWMNEKLGKPVLDWYMSPECVKVHAAVAVREFLDMFAGLRALDKPLLFIGDALTADMPWLKMLLELFTDREGSDPRSPFRLVAPERFTNPLQFPDYLRGRAKIPIDDRRTNYWTAAERCVGLEKWVVPQFISRAGGPHDALYDARIMTHRFGRLFPHFSKKAEDRDSE